MTRTTAIRSLSLCRRLKVALALIAWLPGLAMAHCEKTLRWDDDPPFSMQLPNGDITGIDVELNRAVLAHLDCHVRMRKLPWARALKELELGRLDILPSAFPRPERALYAYYSGPVIPPSRNILFMHRQAVDHWRASRLTDLQHTPFRLGAQIRVFYGPDYQRVMMDPGFSEQVTFVAKRTSLWQMLDLGRIDGVIANEHTGVYEVGQMGLGEQIVATDVVVSREPAEVAFSKASNELDFVEAYSEVLQQLVSDGSYERIVKRYITPGS